MHMQEYSINRLMLIFLDGCRQVGYEFIVKGTVGINIALRSACVDYIQTRKVRNLELEYIDKYSMMNGDRLYDMINHIFTSLGIKSIKIIRREDTKGHKYVRFTYDIVREDNDKIFTIRLERSDNTVYRNYLLGPYMIQGRDANSLIADRISCNIRSDVARARIMYDLYTLTFINGANTEFIEYVSPFYGKVSYSLKQVMEDRSRMEESYKKLDGVSEKPSFNTIYSRAIKFIQPFIHKSNQNLTWVGYTWV